MKCQNRKWFVWLAEYPEEGSTVVETPSRAHAIALVRADLMRDDPDQAPDIELCAAIATKKELAVWEKSKP